MLRKKWIADPKFNLMVEHSEKPITKRELTNGYKIRRGAIDHNIPLIPNTPFWQVLSLNHSVEIRVKRIFR